MSRKHGGADARNDRMLRRAFRLSAPLLVCCSSLITAQNPAPNPPSRPPRTDSTPAQRILARMRAHREPPRPLPDPWLFSIFPYPSYDGVEGFGGGFSGGWHRASRPGPTPLTAAVTVSAFISAASTRQAQVSYENDALVPRWRFLGIFGGDRLARAPYFGLGNDPVGDTADAKRYFRYKLFRTTLFAAVQHDLGRHVRALAGGQFRHYHASALPGDSTLLLRDIASGAVPDTGKRDIAEARFGLLYDTRDEEFSPSRGVFLEAVTGHALTSPAYSRWLFSAREFLPLGEMTVLGLRQTLELADSAVPFYVMYERLTSWRPEDGFGGNTSLRANLPGRYLAPNRAIVSLDLRKKVFDVPLPTSPFRVWVVGFADAGRLWMGGEDPAVSDVKWDAGIGGMLQVSKATLFGLNLGVSKTDGFQFGSAFTFAF